MAAVASINFTVRRRPAVLVTPASPTPRELKRLSDVDGRSNLRLHFPGIILYQGKASMADKDPAVVVRDAVARALVPYYPLAGRLKELDDSKLAVDCTGEGVLFVEADADVRLEQFGDAPLLPPFWCLEELLFNVPGSSAIVGTPLLLFQVTRLACGGFVVALRTNHTMVDGQGLGQFLAAVAELARGAEAPTVQPVWERHLLDGHAGRRGRRPGPGDELDDDDDEVAAEDDDSSSSSGLLQKLVLSPEDMAVRYFFFGPRETAAIRAELSPELRSRASRFDVMAGWLWKHRTMALAPPDSDEVMRMFFVVNVRRRRSSIPGGYYGNAIAVTAAVSTAGELRASPVSRAVALVKEAKDGDDGKQVVDMEYMGSPAHLRRRVQAGAFTLVDESKAGFGDVDVGWGPPAYAGPVHPSGFLEFPWAESYVIPCSSFKDAVVVPVFLPRLTMDRLVHEMGKLQLPHRSGGHGFPSVIKRSAL